MGTKGKELAHRPGTYLYRAVEVPLLHWRGKVPADEPVAVLTVDNDWDTVSFVQQNMEDIAANMMRVKIMNQEHTTRVNESAQLFENNLKPFFTLISATATDHVMDKMSMSLRKALLLMAMDRYRCDSENICRALGLTKSKLERELKRCGLLRQDEAA